MPRISNPASYTHALGATSFDKSRDRSVAALKKLNDLALMLRRVEAGHLPGSTQNLRQVFAGRRADRTGGKRGQQTIGFLEALVLRNRAQQCKVEPCQLILVEGIVRFVRSRSSPTDALRRILDRDELKVHKASRVVGMFRRRPVPNEGDAAPVRAQAGI